MIEYRNVIVLQDARAVRDNLVQELTEHDFAVRSCGSLAGFRHLYALHPSPLIVLTGESDDLARNAHDARVAAPAAVIIALGPATSTAWRLHVMVAGADACHAASIDIVELVAILSSWWRHAGLDGRPDSAVRGKEGLVIPALRQGSPSRHGGRARAGRATSPARAGPGGASVTAVRPPRLGGGWRLDANCRVLVCPRDKAMLLTLAENSFLMRLAASDGQLLHRHAVAAGPHTASRGGRHRDTRGMDVVVSRLRRKARDAGIQLPLLAVRGCGYLFAEWLSVSPSLVMPPALRVSVPRLLAARPSRASSADSYATARVTARAASQPAPRTHAEAVSCLGSQVIYRAGPSESAYTESVSPALCP